MDEDAVNALTVPAGWLYVAGRGPGGHPLFVLGEIERRLEADGVEIYVLGRELVHDLVPVPAMCRPGRIVARRAATLGHLWAALEEAAGAREPGPAADALAEAGASLDAVAADPGAHEGLLAALAGVQLEAAIAHEQGELAEERRGGGRWEALVLRTCGTRAELTARALRDALADAGDGGLLERLIARRERVALALRATAGVWLVKKILPEARPIPSAGSREEVQRRRWALIGCLVEAAIGVEPMNGGFAVLCLTTWLRRHFYFTCSLPRLIIIYHHAGGKFLYMFLPPLSTKKNRKKPAATPSQPIYAIQTEPRPRQPAYPDQ